MDFGIAKGFVSFLISPFYCFFEGKKDNNDKYVREVAYD